MLTEKGEFIPTHTPMILYRRRLRDFFCKTYFIICTHCNEEWESAQIPQIAGLEAELLRQVRCPR